RGVAPRRLAGLAPPGNVRRHLVIPALLAQRRLVVVQDVAVFPRSARGGHLLANGNDPVIAGVDAEDHALLLGAPSLVQLADALWHAIVAELADYLRRGPHEFSVEALHP